MVELSHANATKHRSKSLRERAYQHRSWASLCRANAARPDTHPAIARGWEDDADALDAAADRLIRDAETFSRCANLTLLETAA